jgi:hypothetical protein
MSDDARHISTSPAARIRFYGEARHTWKEAVVEWARAARQDTKPSTLLTVRIRSLPGVALDRGDSAAGIRRVIARLKRMRRGDREAWALVERRLGDLDRELRERDG